MDSIEFNTANLPLTSMKLWEDNSRSISKDEFEKLKNSIKRKPYYMNARPIVCSDRTGENIIIAGNQRYKAVKALGWKEAPAIIFHCQTKEQEVEIAMVDNHNNGEWDVDMLANKFMDYPLDEWLGSDWEKMSGEFAKQEEIIEDEAPEVDEENPPMTKPGDIYQLGQHRLMCGDSTKEEDVKKLMGGGRGGFMAYGPALQCSIRGQNQRQTENPERSERGWRLSKILSRGFFDCMLNNAQRCCVLYLARSHGIIQFSWSLSRGRIANQRMFSLE